MIDTAQQTDCHLVEVILKPGRDYSACRVQYSKDGNVWMPASVYADLDPESVLNGNTFLWNEGQTLGTIRLAGIAEPRLYWNPYIQLGEFEGLVKLKVSFLTSENSYEDECGVYVGRKEVVFLADWRNAVERCPDGTPVPADRKWDVVSAMSGSAICWKKKNGEPPLPLQIPLPVQGLYDIYFGIAKGGLRCLLKIGEEPFSRFEGNGSRYAPGPEGKYNVELYWSRRRLNGTDRLEIAATHRTAGGHHEFGYLSYIKLVPCREPDAMPLNSTAAQYGRRQIDDLILYYEPLSYAVISGIHDADKMNSHMLEEFLRIRPREIACQTARIGSKVLHRSAFLESCDQAAKADDNTVNDDFVKLAQNCDILHETLQYARGRDVRITSCIGMNRPYLWNPTFSEKFSREHPEMIRGGDFDYGFPEVREYAVRLIGELIDSYDLDGLVLDYMRHCLHQTPETLVDVIGRTKRILDRRERLDGKKRELKVRFPANQWNYYKGLETCVLERFVDGLIPSNLNTTFPLPSVEPYIRLCRGTDIKVYGCIDGWTASLSSDPRIGAMMMHHTPKQLAEAIDAYTERGVDGIFVYQGDQFTANPYLSAIF